MSIEAHMCSGMLLRVTLLVSRIRSFRLPRGSQLEMLIHGRGRAQPAQAAVGTAGTDGAVLFPAAACSRLWYATLWICCVVFVHGTAGTAVQDRAGSVTAPLLQCSRLAFLLPGLQQSTSQDCAAGI